MSTARNNLGAIEQLTTSKGDNPPAMQPAGREWRHPANAPHQLHTYIPLSLLGIVLLSFGPAIFLISIPILIIALAGAMAVADGLRRTIPFFIEKWLLGCQKDEANAKCGAHEHRARALPFARKRVGVKKDKSSARRKPP